MDLSTQKLCFSFKVNESKLNDSNLINLSNQIQLVMRRLSEKVDKDYTNVKIEAGRINDDIITGKLRLRFTFTKPNDHEN